MKIAITTNATDNYLYAIEALLQGVAQNIYELTSRRESCEFRIILVGNESMNGHVRFAERLGLDSALNGAPCSIVRVISEHWRESEKYQPEQNLMVAQMRMSAANSARQWGADYFWSLDADVIAPPNALSCSIEMLEFDRGYYDIAFCPYPSQGGGSFLGGHGDPAAPIYPNFRPDEHELPDELKARFEAAVETFEREKSPESHRALVEIRREIEKTCPPKFGGNVLKHNGEFGWRRRGWLDFAYPGIGQGSVVPTDWWGFGCTLFSREALSHFDFVGYYGLGTEDLYVGYQRFGHRGFRSCCITHCPASHAIRKGKDREIVLCHASHEIADSETIGHLRRKNVPFYQHCPGEPFRSEPMKQALHSDEEAEDGVNSAD
jgi:hypothetical protein